MTATINTNKGAIVVELFDDQTPVTVGNFVKLSNDGFYNGVIFHRVIKDFMIQGGDPTGTGTGGPGYQFQDEIVSGLAFDKAGLLAMANSGPNTNGSQFFITTVPTPWLNGKHTIFGEVTEGQDIVVAISEAAAGARDKPIDDVVERVPIEDGVPFILHPGQFALGSTLETVTIPDDIVARIEGKSSLARYGLLIHSTAGFVDPGWRGKLTLEFSNVGVLGITLYYGMKIGHISFTRLSTPADNPYGSEVLRSKYQDQVGPATSRYYLDYQLPLERP